jgi:hypothetical protein
MQYAPLIMSLSYFLGLDFCYVTGFLKEVFSAAKLI